MPMKTLTMRVPEGQSSGVGNMEERRPRLRAWQRTRKAHRDAGFGHMLWLESKMTFNLTNP